MPRAAGRKSAQRTLARNAIARDRQLETHVTTTPTLDRTGPGQDAPDELPADPDAPGTQAEADPLVEAEAPAPSEATAGSVATSGDEVVVVEDVTVQFADQLAVDGISLIVPAGTILGIIGPSGSGKTTTIRLLTGALAPTDGSVRVLGEDPREFRRQTRERIGYMPQQFTLYPDLTARENVDFVGSLFGMLFRSRRRRTREVL